MHGDTTLHITLRYRAFHNEDVKLILPVGPSSPFVHEEHFHTLLEWLFHQFNRGDVNRNELIDLLGLNLPSLSIGDEVLFQTHDGVFLFTCDRVGWKYNSVKKESHEKPTEPSTASERS